MTDPETASPRADAPEITLEILSSALGWFASAVGEDPKAVARDLRRDTALARTIRKALIKNKAPETAQNGRPRLDAERELDQLVVAFLRRPELVDGELTTPSLDSVIEKALDVRHAQGRRGSGGKELTEGGLRTSLKRAPRLSKLGQLFIYDDVLKPAVKTPK